MRNISDETSIPRQLFSFVDFKKLAPRDKQGLISSWYKVQFEIEDSTCKKLITTFDDEAEYLLQRPLDELLKIEKQENGFDLVSEILEEPIGKEYEFEVRITKYNCENRKDSSLTVSKIDKIEKGLVVEGGGEINGIEGIVVGELEVKGWLLEWFLGWWPIEMDDMGFESGG
ncbi:hypothetical protein IFM89_016764 [Coptis chinensis]|uniref:Replication factor A C-terminal domain-containing protein n=1 Tax=Coptis chinensis TaxID=261450 RepID=A0A835LHI0_9MAGN|nr:hypothetical protein IFM89_016764 [Coptis chinensis]